MVVLTASGLPQVPDQDTWEPDIRLRRRVWNPPRRHAACRGRARRRARARDESRTDSSESRKARRYSPWPCGCSRTKPRWPSGPANGACQPRQASVGCRTEMTSCPPGRRTRASSEIPTPGSSRCESASAHTTRSNSASEAGTLRTSPGRKLASGTFEPALASISGVRSTPTTWWPSSTSRLA